MRTVLKKSIIVFLILNVAIIGLSAKGAKETNIDSNEVKIFIDDLNRSVEVPQNPTRITPSGNMANVILLTFDPELLTGLAKKIDYSYFKTDLTSKPIYGAFYGTKTAAFNKEEVIASSPEVIVDIGEIKGSISAMSEELDSLSQILGIPVVFIKSTFDDSAHTYRRLGELLNRKQRGEELAHYADDAINFAKKVREAQKKERTFYYSISSDGLSSFSSSNLHAELFNKVGAANIIKSSISSGIVNVSLEEIISKNPDVILVEDKNAYETITSKNSRWANIKAVKNNKVYLVPINIYSWIDSPPSVNRLLGVYYLANIFYPELAKVDVKEEAKRYFKLFYNYDLKDSEIKL